MKTKKNGVVASSFRDPSGFVFYNENQLYRQINTCYRHHYDQLISSGLYAALLSTGLLIQHDEVELTAPEPELAYKIIKPAHLEFISYPYEWCFSQLKAAALATLQIQEIALQHGMTLKDASAYNIQFRHGKPMLIDTLSFEEYKEGTVWIGYRQFCQHFLAPLSLMALTDIRLGMLLRNHIDGIPLDLAAKLLPLRSRFTPALLIHIHLHAKSQARYSESKSNLDLQQATVKKKIVAGKVSRNGMIGLIHSLRSGIEALNWKPAGTEWGDYYSDTNYSDQAMDSKMNMVGKFIDMAAPLSLWDLGGNTGVVSRTASEKRIDTISFVLGPAAVEKNYLNCIRKNEQNLLPLVLDLTNPSPSIGWHNSEREALICRGPADTVLALALIHHLAISNNVPLLKIAQFFSNICSFLIVEFVPKSDSQVMRLLASREDVFPNYTRDGFEKTFKQVFTIEESIMVTGSERILYLMKKI